MAAAQTPLSRAGALLTWLRAQVASDAKANPKSTPTLATVLHPAVAMEYATESGYALRLKTDLPLTPPKKGSSADDGSVVLAEVPRTLMMNPRTTRSAVAPLVTKQFLDVGTATPGGAQQPDGWTATVLILMHEASLGERSFWWPWLQVLPRGDSCGVPLCWSHEQLSALEGTGVMDKVDFSEIEIDYKTKILPFLTKHASVGGAAASGADALFPSFATRTAAAAVRRAEYEKRKSARAAAAPANSSAAAPAGKNAAKNRKKKLNKKLNALLDGGDVDDEEAKDLAELKAADDAAAAADVCSVSGYKTIVSWLMTRAFAAHTQDGRDFDVLQRQTAAGGASASASSSSAAAKGKDAKTTERESGSGSFAAAGESAAATPVWAATTTPDNVWLCPVIDFVNTEARGDAFNAYIHWTPHSVQLRSMPAPAGAGAATVVLKAGTELLINYADSVQSDTAFHTKAVLSNGELLRRYGFVLEAYDGSDADDQALVDAEIKAKAAAKAKNKAAPKAKTRAPVASKGSGAESDAKAVDLKPRVNRYSANDTVEIPVIQVAATCKRAVDEQTDAVRRSMAAEARKRKRAADAKGKDNKKGKKAKADDEDEDDEDDDDGEGEGEDGDDDDEYGVGDLDYEYFVIKRDGAIPSVMRQLTLRYAKMMDDLNDPTALLAKAKAKKAAKKQAAGDATAAATTAGAAPVVYDEKSTDDLELLFLVFATRLADYGTSLDADRKELAKLRAAAKTATAFDIDQHRLRQALVVRIGEKEILEKVCDTLRAKIQELDDAEADGEGDGDDGDEDNGEGDDDGDSEGDDDDDADK